MPEQSEPASEAIGLLAAMVVLLFAFGSVIAMGLPIITAVIGLGIGLGGHRRSSRPSPTCRPLAPTLATMIGIAVGIDYALFIVTRHRQHLAEGPTSERRPPGPTPPPAAPSLFAGVTVVIAIAGLAVVGIPMLTSWASPRRHRGHRGGRRPHPAARPARLRRPQHRPVPGPRPETARAEDDGKTPRHAGPAGSPTARWPWLLGRARRHGRAGRPAPPRCASA